MNIRQLDVLDIDKFTEIAYNAHPYDASKKDVKNFFKWTLENDKGSNLYGLFRNNELLGGMKLYDLRMNLLSKKIDVGGVGAIAVDLLHKKEKVCKEMMKYFMKHYKDKGLSLVILYPFRADFYRRMGFGYGSKVKQFRLKPTSFPKTDKSHLTLLGENDKHDVIHCYNRYLEQNNGMIERIDPDADDLFNSNTRLVGYKENGQVRGIYCFYLSRRRAREHGFK